MEARPDRADGTIEDFSSLLIRHLVQIAEHDRLPIVAWKREDELPQARDRLLPGESIERVIRPLYPPRWLGMFLAPRLFGERNPPPLPLHSTPDEMARDPIEISDEGTPCPVEPSAVLRPPQDQKDLLCQILCQRLLPAHPQKKPINPPLVLAIEREKGLIVAGSNRRQPLRIGHTEGVPSLLDSLPDRPSQETCPIVLLPSSVIVSKPRGSSRNLSLQGRGFRGEDGESGGGITCGRWARPARNREGMTPPVQVGIWVSINGWGSPSWSGGQLGGHRLPKLTRHVRANGGDKMVIDDDGIATGTHAGLLIFEE